MPKTAAGEPWEIGFRAAVRADAIGWTASNHNGKIRLEHRPPGTGSKQSVVLPLSWESANTNKALLLINQIRKVIAKGDAATLKPALVIAQGSSTTMKPALDWQVVADDLRDALMTGRNEILATTWRDNYQPYITEALRLIAAGEAVDGHSLLKSTLAKWTGKAPSRQACAIALTNLVDQAIGRHHAPRCWTITKADKRELVGKKPKRREKAVLTDSELVFLIDGIASRNPRWANVIKVLTLFGLRPIELQHLVPNQQQDGSRGIKCTYEKTCGGSSTDPRQLQPCWLQDTDGSAIRWNLIELMHAGLLELPLGNDGEPRQLNGHYVEQFLKRQPEWKQLKQVCEARGEWLRTYSFRDSYSARAHRQRVEVGAICDAMGHDLAAHSRAYRWSTEASTAAAFAGAGR